MPLVSSAAGVSGVSGAAAVLSATDVLDVKGPAGVECRVPQTLQVLPVPRGSQVLLPSRVLREPPVSQDPRCRCRRGCCGCHGYCSCHRCHLCRGRLKGHTRGLGLGYLPSFPGWVRGGGLGLVVFSCESWVVPCLEWSPTGTGRPVAGWMAQGLETGVLSC